MYPGISGHMQKEISQNQDHALYELEDPSLLLSPPSNRRGSPSKSMISVAVDHPLYTGNAS